MQLSPETVEDAAVLAYMKLVDQHFSFTNDGAAPTPSPSKLCWGERHEPASRKIPRHHRALSQYVGRVGPNFYHSPRVYCSLVLRWETLNPGFAAGCVLTSVHQAPLCSWQDGHPNDALEPQNILKAFKSCCGLTWATVASLMLWRMSVGFVLTFVTPERG